MYVKMAALDIVFILVIELNILLGFMFIKMIGVLKMYLYIVACTCKNT